MAGPFPFGHEFVAEIVSLGDAVMSRPWIQDGATAAVRRDLEPT